MSNPFDRFQDHKMFHGASYNFTGVLNETTATDITIAVDGYYRVGASVDWRGRGPTAATAAATKASLSSFFQAGSEWIIHCAAAQHISQIAASTAVADGHYWVCLVSQEKKA